MHEKPRPRSLKNKKHEDNESTLVANLGGFLDSNDSVKTQRGAVLFGFPVFSLAPLKMAVISL